MSHDDTVRASSFLATLDASNSSLVMPRKRGSFRIIQSENFEIRSIARASPLPYVSRISTRSFTMSPPRMELSSEVDIPRASFAILVLMRSASILARSSASVPLEPVAYPARNPFSTRFTNSRCAVPASAARIVSASRCEGVERATIASAIADASDITSATNALLLASMTPIRRALSSSHVRVASSFLWPSSLDLAMRAAAASVRRRFGVLLEPTTRHLPSPPCAILNASENMESLTSRSDVVLFSSTSLRIFFISLSCSDFALVMSDFTTSRTRSSSSRIVLATSNLAFSHLASIDAVPVRTTRVSAGSG